MKPAYSVAILCGGMSRRMGQDKATMLYHRLPMVCHLADAFSGAREILLSVRDEAQRIELTETLRRGTRAGQAHPRITFVIDPVKGAGPPVFFLACYLQFGIGKRKELCYNRCANFSMRG